MNRATMWKYEHPDHLQGTFDVDVLEETDDGSWVRVPAASRPRSPTAS